MRNCTQILKLKFVTLPSSAWTSHLCWMIHILIQLYFNTIYTLQPILKLQKQNDGLSWVDALPLLLVHLKLLLRRPLQLLLHHPAQVGIQYPQDKFSWEGFKFTYKSYKTTLPSQRNLLFFFHTLLVLSLTGLVNMMVSKALSGKYVSSSEFLGKLSEAKALTQGLKF